MPHKNQILINFWMIYDNLGMKAAIDYLNTTNYYDENDDDMLSNAINSLSI